MSFEVQKGASTGKKPDGFYLLHHPISFLYSFFQKTLKKEKVKGKGRRVFLLVLSLFPILSNQEAPHLYLFQCNCNFFQSPMRKFIVLQLISRFKTQPLILFKVQHHLILLSSTLNFRIISPAPENCLWKHLSIDTIPSCSLIH